MESMLSNVKVRIYYDDNRRKGRSWDIDLKIISLFLFPSTLLYCISNKQKEKIKFYFKFYFNDYL